MVRNITRAALFVFSLIILASCTTQDAAQERVPDYEWGAEYHVYGSCKMFVTYAAAGEVTQQDEVYSGWYYKFNPSPGDFLYVSAQKECESGTVRVELYKRGKLAKVAQSTAAYGIATASDTY